MKREKLYIAYGSNMNVAQMKRRCRTAVAVAVGEVKDYRLRFYGRYDSAVATIEAAKGSSVPVLVWKIRPNDEKSLDIYEGYPHLYRKETINVEVNGKQYSGMVYIMNENPAFSYSHPSPYYVRTIAEGYKTCGLDPQMLYEAISKNCK